MIIFSCFSWFSNLQYKLTEPSTLVTQSLLRYCPLAYWSIIICILINFIIIIIIILIIFIFLRNQRTLFINLSDRHTNFVDFLYIIPYIYLKLNQYSCRHVPSCFSMIVMIMQKLSASLIAHPICYFRLFVAERIAGRRTAFIVAMVFAFATNTWTISSQALWQHGLVELFLAISIFLVLRYEKHSSNRLIICLGILSGLFLFNRPIDSILLISVIYYIFAMKGEKLYIILFRSLISSIPFIFYNLNFFGSFFGGYSLLLSGFDLSSDMISRLIGLLISPSRGLFIYTPIILLSILGYFKIYRLSNKKIKDFLLILGLFELGSAFCI